MREKTSLRDRLYKYLLRQHGFVASGDLQRLVVAHTDYTPRTAVRRLEEMAEAGNLEVQYRKGHAYYRVAPKPYENPVQPIDLAYHRELVRRFDANEEVFV